MYDMPPDDYYSRLSAQDGKCAIESCGNYASERSLHVDHNHDTGSVRGLLCSKCNTALGLVNENTEILVGLIDYLNMHDGTTHGGFVASIYKSDQLN